MPVVSNLIPAVAANQQSQFAQGNLLNRPGRNFIPVRSPYGVGANSSLKDYEHIVIAGSHES